MAQQLYVAGYISYPRTSSQKLPKEIEYEKIIKTLLNQEKFSKECAFLLAKKELKPNEGKKTDPAHPSIYPTGIPPKLAGKEEKLYELIVRRFLAVFGDSATRETVKIEIDVKKEIFIAKGTRTTVKGWHELYGQFIPFKEEELPPVEKGDEIKIKKIEFLSKETQPPKRYTPASIIKELEKRGLGTKATRAAIVDALYQRGYVDEKSITATNLGIKTVEVLEKFSPDILDEELTRHFELEMEQIRQNKKKKEKVLDDAKKLLTKTLAKFKKNEKDIGEGLSAATKETSKEMSRLGNCQSCEGELVIKKGKFGMFIACDKYPECKVTFKLPTGKFKPTKKVCEKCNHPMIKILKGKKSQDVCINLNCEGKQIEEKEIRQEAAKIESGEITKECPKCKKGNLVLRKSIYGQFYGCSKYPKCKFTKAVVETEYKKKSE